MEGTETGRSTLREVRDGLGDRRGDRDGSATLGEVRNG